MAVFLVIYLLVLVAVSVYVAVNFYHVIRFRLEIPGDRSYIALTLYVIVVLAIWVASLVMASISYQI